MEKIDRLGWADGMAFTAYGVRVGIRLNRSAPEVWERILRRLPPGWKPATSPVVDYLYSLIVGGEGHRPGVRHFHVLYADSARLARTMDLDEALGNLETDLRLYVAAWSPRRVFVHAGVVGWNGRAIVIPGMSFTGKSTLVEAWVRAGATYYSDEYAVLDRKGRVHPFPVPLSIRDSEGKVLRQVPPEALGSAVGTRPIPVGWVWVTQYRPGSRWRPRRISPGRAVLELLAHTVNARVRPKLALEVLCQVASKAVVLKGRRGEAEAVVDEWLAKWVTE
jgi:hypothetical protein